MFISISLRISSSSIMFLIHDLSLAIKVAAMYSTFVLGSGIDTCLLFYEIGTPNVKTMLDVEWEVSIVHV